MADGQINRPTNEHSQQRKKQRLNRKSIVNHTQRLNAAFCVMSIRMSAADFISENFCYVLFISLVNCVISLCAFWPPLGHTPNCRLTSAFNNGSGAGGQGAKVSAALLVVYKIKVYEQRVCLPRERI